MQPRIKLVILIMLVAVIAAGGLFFLSIVKKTNKVTPAANTSAPAKNQLAPGADETTLNPIRQISGKIRSINEKAVYLELADGKGFAAYINSNTPVFTLGASQAGTLVDLKPGQEATVKVDQADKALEIIINK